jgi:hypothetical protein
MTLIIALVSVGSLQDPNSSAQKGLIKQSLSRLEKHTAFYNPVRGQEILYLNNQIAIYLKNTIEDKTLADQTGLNFNQNNKVSEYMNNLKLADLKNLSPAAEIACYYLADDDINAAICVFRPRNVN